ncbi:MAG: STAS domain-containing protein [Actinoallomurus sp.]
MWAVMEDMDSLYDDGFLAIRATTDGLVFAGEIDRRNSHVVRRALEDVAAHSADSIHLDLGAVTYCDTVALSTLLCPVADTDAPDALINSAADGAGSGRAVVLHATPSWMRAMLRMLGWDCLPGVQMEEGA